MNIIQAIILGIIQGITEFMPISSSAHLVVFPYLFGWQIPTDQNFSFDVLVQLGTLLSLILYFRKDVWHIFLAVLQGIEDKAPFRNENSRLGWLVLLATIPAGLAGILLKSKVEAVFRNPALTAFFLFGTAFLLLIAEIIGKRSLNLSRLSWKNAIVVGFFQAVSIFPGISRSGACIAGGMVQNFHRKDSARFSFLLAIPIMVAAGLLGVFDLLKVKDLVQFLPMLVAGFIAAALMGYLVIHWMLNYLNKHSLFVFSCYCIILGVLVLGFSIYNPQKQTTADPIGNYPVILVNYPSSLSWLVSIINDCNKNSTALSLKFLEQANPTLSTSPTINFGFEDNYESDSVKYIIGYETLKIASNKTNPLVQLNIFQLKNLFKGIYTTWANFINGCEQCTNINEFTILTDKAIQLWSYPIGNNEQKLFSRTILSDIQPPLNVFIAPDAKNMVEALQINPAALGYLPAHWINEPLKSIEITDYNPEEFKFPIMVSVSLLPIQSYDNLFVCIQNSLQKNKSG
jgi:undecaprenyl-diphosphatase